ncbi:tail fiber protein [Bradyrhizobium sp. 26S5]|uniref:phage tail protein n=1 Tax=Bradyrhizobium sp. 26S5 TaxID=3139729 RepID=UPI0030CCA377
MSFWKWSRVAASNATADPSCSFPEGMAPSALNDGARGQMAALAKYRDDISGAIVTTGTSTAYAVASNQGFDSLTHLGGAMIAFSPHAANAGPCTLNVDGLGAVALRSAPGVDIAAGTILQGTPYLAIYNSTDNAFYLHGFFGNPYNVPIGGCLIFWGSVAPNSSFVFCNGSQAPSRTAYSKLFSIIGTTYGVGDGSTTFGLPNCTGRVPAGADPGGLNLSGAVFNFLTPGGVGGVESVTLSPSQIPSHTHNNTLTDPGHVHGGVVKGSNAYNSPGGATVVVQSLTAGATDSATTGITLTNAATGGGGSHINVQPTILCNYIMRII